MPERYFDKFSTIAYSNNVAVNITERAVVLNSVINNPYLYYPLDVSNGVRPDQLSDTYYNDQYMSWVLYLSNQIIDPYYQWYIAQNDFNDVLLKKYNVKTIDTLQKKVAFWRNNWYNAENISVAQYNQTIVGTGLAKYWEPVFNGSSRPIQYQRVQKDWVINTNRLRQYTTSNNASGFIKNEVVNIVFDSNNTGRGQVVIANSSSVTLQHIFGTNMPNNSVVITDASYLRGQESNTTVTISTASIVADNIIYEEEGIYWESVSIYDMENEKNEQNKSIQILNAAYAPQLAAELKNLLG